MLIVRALESAVTPLSGTSVTVHFWFFLSYAGTVNTAVCASVLRLPHVKDVLSREPPPVTFSLLPTVPSEPPVRLSVSETCVPSFADTAVAPDEAPARESASFPADVLSLSFTVSVNAPTETPTSLVASLDSLNTIFCSPSA